ncbi:MAG: phenylalanine--tRNA ligase subunit beta [Minisyncoccia bacterium]
MKISRDWLQKYFHAPLPNAAELADALTFHAFEIESVTNVGLTKSHMDAILDVKVTPNRGHDCLSYRGIAKEISAILRLPLSSDPLKEIPNLEPVTDELSVLIEDTELSPRYIAGFIRGVKVGPSPEWLVKRLESMGQKSINNIVDATNFVMFNIGQPLHAFDAGRLEVKDLPAQAGGKYAIEVRKAREGEILRALDEKEYALKPGMLVISDKNADAAIGIAGVKGGAPAGITEATRDIILESANFSGVSVRHTAKALNLRTDASQRFEQGISPELAGFGMRAATDLILKLAGGELVGFADAYPKPHTPLPIVLHAQAPSKVLGVEISLEMIRNVFTRLGFSFEEKTDEFIVTPSFERLDLQHAEDLIEEIARIIGYDAVSPAELPVSDVPVPVNQNFYASERVREDLTALGYSEVFTSVFADKGERAVLNKVDSVRPFLRSTLVDGLNDALKKNVQNKDLLGLKEVKLFEIGTVWKEGKEEMMAGIVTEKEKAKEDPLSMYVKDASSYEALPLSETSRYQAFSRYPSITRDIALWVPIDTVADEVKSVIKNVAGSLCVRIDLFDEFKKEDKTSYAFRLVFQSFEKTLTDNEINADMENVYTHVKSREWVVR